MSRVSWIMGAVVALSVGVVQANETTSSEKRASSRAGQAVDDTVKWAQPEEGKQFDFSPRTDQHEYSVTLNGGVAGFTGALGETSRTGATAGVAVGSSFGTMFDIEGGFEGSRFGIDDPLVASADQSIYRYNLYGLGKLGPSTRSGFKPFVAAGLGGSYVNVTDGAVGPYRNDFLGEIPVGAGIDFNRRGLTAGVRGTYRFLFADEWQEPAPALNNPSGGLLGAQVNVGGRF